MKILLLEYFTAIPSRSVDPALRSEGGAMRDAVAVDLARVPGAGVTVLHRPGLAPPRAPGLSGRSVTQDPEAVLAAQAGRFDAALLIAPEDGGTLERLSRVVRRTGCRLLGPGPEAVCFAADKLRTARILRAHGIATPRTSTLRLDRRTPGRLLVRPLPFVLKPRDACGCQGRSLRRCGASVGRPGATRPWCRNASPESMPACRSSPSVIGSCRWLWGGRG